MYKFIVTIIVIQTTQKHQVQQEQNLYISAQLFL